MCFLLSASFRRDQSRAFGERAWDAVRTCLAFAGLAAAFSLASLLQVACAPTLHAAWVQLWGIRGVGQGSALRIFVSCRLAASAAGLALAARDLTAQPAPSPASDWCLAALLAATAVLMLLWLCADLRDPYARTIRRFFGAEGGCTQYSDLSWIAPPDAHLMNVYDADVPPCLLLCAGAGFLPGL